MKITEKITSILFSTRLMAFLFFAYGAALGIGTFIETYYSTDTAKIWIYNAWWFELIMVLFALNFFGNIQRYNLLKKENWAVFVLHISWLFILLGAFVTRYISDEGRMSIREGETTDFYTSELTYITAQVDGKFQGEELRKAKQTQVLFAEATQNKYQWNDDFKGKNFEISYLKFIKNASEEFIKDANGEYFLKLVESSDGTRHEHYLKNGTATNIHNTIFTLNKPEQGAFNLIINEKGSFIIPPSEGLLTQMATQEVSQIQKEIPQPLHFKALYNFGSTQFVLPQPMQKGKIGIVKNKTNNAMPMNNGNEEDAILLKISSGNESKEVAVFGRKDVINPPTTTQVNGLTFHISYGSIRKELPFKIKLNDFIADKYPGTEKSYSAFKSKVTVIDNTSFNYDIFMNHILNYKGYRFFQASFHPDEKGTILSVNHDYWGTLLTYIGYTLLYVGLIASMFFGKTRFKLLCQKLGELQKKRITSLIIFAMISGVSWGQHSQMMPSQKEILQIIQKTKVSPEHAEKFGGLVIQDDDGRMKPINTFSSELLRKISKNDSFEGLNADQVLLSMLLNPQEWYNNEFFYIKKANDSLHKILGVEKGKKYVKALDFFDNEFNYKLSPFLQEAYSASNPTQIQKDFKEADLKINLLNRALSGGIIRIFPLLNSHNNKWISPLEYRQNPMSVTDSLYGNFINNSFSLYLNFLKQATQTGDYTNADKVLNAFKENQRKYAWKILPSEDKIKAEILYNKYDVFKTLFSWYLLAGIVLFTLLLLQIFTTSFSENKKGKVLKYLILFSKLILIISFIFHTIGLGFRWYISGHAPWSNAYESMIYVGWATMASGLFFMKRSELTFAATAFVTSMILMIAHWNWMDPAIGTLEPVLNSYWLMIHVAIIVGSYGPFALGAILGSINLILITITSEKNKQKVNSVIKELNIVNELSLTVGLILLTIGTFLGGQWANESWGRYWGWDPKETWSLVSIMVYAFVIHMRIVPGLRGRWAFNFMSVVAFASILMTYFGVNFYLAGLHSYASGDKVITPNFVYYSVGIVLLLGIISFLKEKKLKQK